MGGHIVAKQKELIDSLINSRTTGVNGSRLFSVREAEPVRAEDVMVSFTPGDLTPVWYGELCEAFNVLAMSQCCLSATRPADFEKYLMLAGERDYHFNNFLNTLFRAREKYDLANEAELRAAQLKIKETVSKLSLPVSVPDNTFWEYIQKVISLVDDQYLSIYENVVARQTEYWRLYSQIQQLTAPKVDGEKYIVDTKLITELEKLLFLKDGKFVSGTDKSFILFPKQKDDASGPVTTSKEEAEKWQKELGLPAECVVMADNGEYLVVVDYTPIQEIHTLCKRGLNFENAAEYNAWYTAVKSHVDNLQSTCTTVTTKYSNANSVYDTIIKVLSSTITTMLDANKALLSNLR